jgi:hypothetical protein
MNVVPRVDATARFISQPGLALGHGTAGLVGRTRGLPRPQRQGRFLARGFHGRQGPPTRGTSPSDLLRLRRPSRMPRVGIGPRTIRNMGWPNRTRTQSPPTRATPSARGHLPGPTPPQRDDHRAPHATTRTLTSARPERHPTIHASPLMPTLPTGYCPVPACPEKKPCKKHVRPRGARWQKVRHVILRRDVWCQWPAGCSNFAEQVDHIVPLAFGGPAWAQSNLRGLCREHHRQATRAHR